MNQFITQRPGVTAIIGAVLVVTTAGLTYFLRKRSNSKKATAETTEPTTVETKNGQPEAEVKTA